MTVGYAEYGPHVGDQDALKLSVAGAVEETGQVVAKELRVRMQAPDLTLTVRGWARPGAWGGPLGSILGPVHVPWVPSPSLGSHPHPSAPSGPSGVPLGPVPHPCLPRSCWRRRWWARRCRCRWSSRTRCRGR